MDIRDQSWNKYIENGFSFTPLLERFKPIYHRGAKVWTCSDLEDCIHRTEKQAFECGQEQLHNLEDRNVSI